MQKIDKKSLENVYKLFETGKINHIEIGTTKSLQQIYKYLFDGLYNFAGKIREKTFQKVVLSLLIVYILKKPC
jgi:cell filamentation protein